jgi:DNA-binding response OmpR family regulator
VGPNRLEKSRILLVDDDSTITTSFQMVLQNEGYDVDTASDGRQALERFERENYQLVILDIKLPDINGIEVARRIRKHNDDVRLVIVTGYPELEDSIETIELGIEEILLKPVNVEELIHVIRSTVSTEA